MNLPDIIASLLAGGTIASAGYCVGRALHSKPPAPRQGFSWSKLFVQGPEQMAWRRAKDAPMNMILVVAQRGRPGGQNFAWPPQARFAYKTHHPLPEIGVEPARDHPTAWMNFHTGQLLDFEPEWFVILADLPAMTSADVAPAMPAQTSGPPL